MLPPNDVALRVQNIPLSPSHPRGERPFSRRALLDAARMRFARASYDAVTVEQIAEAAGIGKGTVYNYFPRGKRAMLRTLFDALLDDLRDLTGRSASARGTDPSLRAVLRAYCGDVILYFRSHPDQFGLLVQQGQQPAHGHRGDRSTLFMEMHALLTNTLAADFEALKRNGRPAPASPHMTAGFVLGSLYTFLFTSSRPSEFAPRAPRLAHATDEAIDVAIDVAIDELITLMLEGIGHPAASSS